MKTLLVIWIRLLEAYIVVKYMHKDEIQVPVEYGNIEVLKNSARSRPTYVIFHTRSILKVVTRVSVLKLKVNNPGGIAIKRCRMPRRKLSMSCV